MRKNYIEDVFVDLKKLKDEGIHFSGIYKEGEYMRWYNNGKLNVHCFYKNKQLHGVFKSWDSNGNLATYCIYEKGISIKDLME